MDLQSPENLLKAWAIVPLLVLLASLGLGLGLSLVSGLRLEALTAPAGYLTGIGLMTFGVQVGLSGKLVTVICVVLAAAGPAALLWRRRATLRAWRPVGWQ